MENVDVNNIYVNIRSGQKLFEMDFKNLQGLGNGVYQLTMDTLPCQGGRLEVTLKNLRGNKTFFHPDSIPASLRFCKYLPHGNNVSDTMIPNANAGIAPGKNETISLSSMPDVETASDKNDIISGSMMPTVEMPPGKNDTTVETATVEIDNISWKIFAGFSAVAVLSVLAGAAVHFSCC